MRLAPLVLVSAIAPLALVAATATAAPRPPYPVFDARVMPPAARPAGPRIAAEAFEIRLTREASARVATSAPATGRASALGVANLDRLAREHGLAFEPEFPGERAPLTAGEPDFTAFYVVHVPPGADVLALLDRVESLPEVASASALPVLRLGAVFPNDSLFASSWWHYQPGNRVDIRSPEAWEVTTGSASILVAILDSGVIPYHPDLGGTTAGAFGNLWRHAAEVNGAAGVDDDGNGYVDDVSGWDFVSLASGVDVAAGEDWRDEDADPNDFVGHGTACAGLVGALSNNTIGVTGTAWNVRLMPLRVAWSYLGAGPGEGEVRMDFVARAIRYATRAGAHVLNCSFATGNTDGLDAAATAAVQAGVTIVCSSGNFGSADYLARRPDVISVAATNRDDIVAGFSNVNADVDLCAPGVDIVSTWRRSPGGATDSLGLRQPGYSGPLQGTSFAAPLVAGAAALLQSQRVAAGLPLLAPAGVRLRLWETADDVAALNPTLVGQVGGGRLNVAAALAATDGSTATRLGGTVVGSPVVIAANSGRDRVAFVTSNEELIVLDAMSADTLVRVVLPDLPVAGLAAVTLDFGRTVGLFAGTLQGSMLGYDLEGNSLPGWPTTALGATLDGGPAIGDLDADGFPEIVCGGHDAQIHAWKLDGSVAPGFPRALGFDRVTAVAIASLDTVPGDDIVAVNEAGLVAVHRGTGQRVPGWPKTVPPSPRAPVVVGNMIGVVSGTEDHRFLVNGSVEPGTPGVLSGPAIADPALDYTGLGSYLLVVPVGPPFGLEVRDFSGSIPFGAFPVALVGGVIGTPVLAPEGSSSPPAVVVHDGRGLLAFDLLTGERIAGLPKPGDAGLRPTIWDVGRDGIPDIVAGSGPDSAFYIYRGATGLFAPLVAGHWGTPRGNPMRTGSPGSGSYGSWAFLDDVRPAAVTDVSVVASDDTSVTLRWTATGSDSLTWGRVQHWLVRGTDGSMNDASFGSAPVQRVFNSVASPGGTETFVLSPLTPGTRYEWALKGEDRAGNRSALSNVVATGFGPGLSFAIHNHPSQVPLTFEWRGSTGAPSTLRVFDLSGRKRATMPLGNGAGGSFTWYGADDEGRRLEAGLYFVRFTSGRETIEKRLVVLP